MNSTVVTDMPTIQRAWEVLNDVMDPEIPVISVVELGIVNGVDLKDEAMRVSITPTYVACVATNIMKLDMQVALEAAGFSNVKVDVRHAPAWTSDRMTEVGRTKLEKYGIAPPGPRGDPNAPPKCTNCGSEKTSLISAFSSSACKSLYKCDECKEPFERFKCK